MSDLPIYMYQTRLRVKWEGLMMNKPKFVIQPKHEERGSGNRLAFTSQAREKASKRFDQTPPEEAVRIVTHEKLKVIPYRHRIEEKKEEKEDLDRPIQEVPSQVKEKKRQEKENDAVDRNSWERENQDIDRNSQEEEFQAVDRKTKEKPDQPDDRNLWEKERGSDFLPIGDKKIDLYEKKMKPPVPRRTNGLLKLVFSIVGSILLGSFFGYLLLMFLISADWFQEDTSIPPAITGTNGTASEGEGRKVIPADQVNLDPSQVGQATAGALQLADRTFYAIQGGVFTDRKTGETQADAIRKRGLPALLFDDDSLRLFLGISYRKEDALNLAGFFQNRGVEIYLKEYTVPGGKMLFPDANRDQLEQLNLFLTHGTYLLEKTATWSGQGVIGKANISDEEWKKFKDTHRLFLLESKRIEPILSDEQKGLIGRMTTEMNTAITGMIEYVKNPNVDYLLQSQQALLNYFDQYRNFLASSGVNVSYKP